MPLSISLEHLAEHNQQCEDLRIRLSEDQLNLLYTLMGESDTPESLPIEHLVTPPWRSSQVRKNTIKSLIRLLHTVPQNRRPQAERLAFLAYHYMMLDVLSFLSHTTTSLPAFRALTRAAYRLRDIRDTAKAHEGFAALVHGDGRLMIFGGQHNRVLRDLAVSTTKTFEIMADALTYEARLRALSTLCSVMAIVEVYRLYYMARGQLKLQTYQTLQDGEIMNRADDFGTPRLARFFDLALADLTEEAA